MKKPKRVIVHMRIEDVSRREVIELPNNWIKTITYEQVSSTPTYDWQEVTWRTKTKKKPARKKK